MTSPINAHGATVLLFEHPVPDGRILAEARLNAESTLNALSLDMIDIMDPALRQWQDDERVAAVVLTGAGERAFSAGGDIQALYRAMVRNHQAGERIDEYPYDFFEREYRLDYLLHIYRKPVVALGHGVIMGGGLGIFSGASFRVVSEKVRIALPEVTIGLFPDAGATWFLRNIAPTQALFLGMTGSHINGADALVLKLATHSVAKSDFEGLIDSLRALRFSGRSEADAALIASCLRGLPAAAQPESQLSAIPDSAQIDVELGEALEALQALAGRSGWIDRGLSTLNSGCPTTVGIVLEQLKRARTLDLADCFRMEMTIATHCADNHDFAEGVRALLIDKDNRPVWQFGDLASLPQAYVLSHFAEPWTRNPLHDLEQTS